MLSVSAALTFRKASSFVSLQGQHAIALVPDTHSQHVSSVALYPLSWQAL